MANVKISNLPVETDINNIIGFAGYNAAGTCKISGADLINTLPSSTPTLGDVLTAGDDAIDQSIFFKTTSDIRVLRLDKNGVSMNNFATDLLISANSGGRLFLNSNSNDVVIQALGTGQVVFNTPEIALQSGDVLDSTSSAGSTGQVLSSLGAGNGTEWVAAGGPASGLGDVLTTDNESNDGQVLAMIDGVERLEVSKDQIRHTGTSGDFDIVNSNGTLRLSATGGLGLILNSSNTIKVLDDVEFDVNGIIDRLGNLGTGGQFLASTGSALEWTTPTPGVEAVAFSPINVGNADTAPTAASTQYYYQTVAEATMTISSAKLWGFSGSNTVLFGIYRGTFGSLTLIGQGSALCSTGPNVINLVAEPGQSLSVTAGEDIVVGLYPSGTSWRTIYDDGVSDVAFGISNTANISSMPASPTGGQSSIRFALTLY